MCAELARQNLALTVWCVPKSLDSGLGQYLATMHSNPGRQLYAGRLMRGARLQAEVVPYSEKHHLRIYVDEHLTKPIRIAGK